MPARIQGMKGLNPFFLPVPESLQFVWQVIRYVLLHELN